VDHIKRKKSAYIAARPYLMIAPAITGIAIFTLYPLIDLIRLSFMKIDLMDDTQSHFIGIDNYKEVFARQISIRLFGIL
jgi:sn-glycerol 3-phosphate transport system permease protein